MVDGGEVKPFPEAEDCLLAFARLLRLNGKMKIQSSLLTLLLIASLGVFSAQFASAGSATWNLNPTNGNWNTGANWTPNTVPNGPSDIATFGASNTTAISISAGVEVNGITYNP